MSTTLPFHTVDSGPNPQRCMIWLHGLGADGHDLAPLSKELVGKHHQPVRCIFPHAPSRPVAINGGYTMPAWYDIQHQDINRDHDLQGIQQSHLQIQALIDLQIAQGINAKDIVLAGFSQGGAMAIYTGLRQTLPLGGIIALSCYHLLADSQLKHPPQQIFIGHGQLDPIVPIQLGQQLQQAMVAQGHDVHFQQYPMEHSISPIELQHIQDWLARPEVHLLSP